MRIVATCAIVLALTVAAPAGAADPVKTLERQVKALTARVSVLEAKTRALERFRAAVTAQLACLHGGAFPVGRFGAPPAEGYLYTTGGGPSAPTTALDLFDDLTGLVPGRDFVWMPTVAPGCVEPGSAARAAWRRAVLGAFARSGAASVGRTF